MRYAGMKFFRRRRGELLAAQIRGIAADLGRSIRILDVGGTETYWRAIDLGSIEEIVVLNRTPPKSSPAGISSSDGPRFRSEVGDACDLAQHDDHSFDLVHSNSVIEHVGPWLSMHAMATECRRVAPAGWVQTPAFSFPIEPHVLLPFAHWVGKPAQAQMLRISPRRPIRERSYASHRHYVDSINMLSKRDFAALFPDAEIIVERLGLPKSYVARWGVAA